MDHLDLDRTAESILTIALKDKYKIYFTFEKYILSCKVKSYYYSNSIHSVLYIFKKNLTSDVLFSSSSILVAVVLNWDADMPYHERVYTPREWFVSEAYR